MEEEDFKWHSPKLVYELGRGYGWRADGHRTCEGSSGLYE